ncbi:hypothetical protein M1567_00120 [Candidatus Marsarchaeota archaeon]|nr:hypothetical protein [Candidatus Marsarchaeota archaeon]
MLLAIAFVSLIGYSNASSKNITCALTGQSLPISQAGVCIESAMPFAIIGLLVSFAMVAVAFMFGNVFNLPSLKNWYKGELWETTKTIILIALIFAVLIILGALALGLTGSSIPVSYIQGSQSGITSAIGENLNALYASVLANYVNPDMLMVNESYYGLEGLATGIGDLKKTTINEWIPIPIPFVGSIQFGSSNAALLASSVIESDTALPGFSFIKDIISIVLIPVYIVFSVLSVDLYSIVIAGLTLFIPIGIVFRAFPFLRGLGGSFIAIGIAIALVFPALLIMFNLPIQNFILPLIFSQSASYAPGQTCSYLTFNFFEDIACGPASLAFSVSSGVLIGVQTSNQNYAGVFNNGQDSALATLFNSNGGSIYPSINFINFYTYGVLLQLILFIFDIVITIVIAGALAQMLGGKLSLGVGKFKIA